MFRFVYAVRKLLSSRCRTFFYNTCTRSVRSAWSNTRIESPWRLCFKNFQMLYFSVKRLNNECSQFIDWITNVLSLLLNIVMFIYFKRSSPSNIKRRTKFFSTPFPYLMAKFNKILCDLQLWIWRQWTDSR